MLTDPQRGHPACARACRCRCTSSECRASLQAAWDVIACLQAEHVCKLKPLSGARYPPRAACTLPTHDQLGAARLQPAVSKPEAGQQQQARQLQQAVNVAWLALCRGLEASHVAGASWQQ